MAPKTKVVLHPKENTAPPPVRRNPAIPPPELAGIPATSSNLHAAAVPGLSLRKTAITTVRNSFAALVEVPPQQHLSSAAIPTDLLQENDRSDDGSDEETSGEYCCSDENCNCDASSAAGSDSDTQAGSDSDAQAGCDSDAQAGCDSDAQADSDAEGASQLGSASDSNKNAVGDGDDAEQEEDASAMVVGAVPATIAAPVKVIDGIMPLRRTVSEPAFVAGNVSDMDSMSDDSQAENDVVPMAVATPAIVDAQGTESGARTAAETVAAAAVETVAAAAVETVAAAAAENDAAAAAGQIAVDEGNENDDCGKLDYVPVSVESGKLMIAPRDEDISCCKKKWHECLVGYFVGSSLPENVVKESARRMWEKKGLVSTFMTRRGFFFFRFDSEIARKKVLETGPHFMFKHPIVLQQYVDKMRLVKERQRQIALWVKFFDVPVELLSYRGISLVASAVGKPLYLDEATKKMVKSPVDRFNFARVCVMADAERPLPNEMFVDYGDGDEHIKIEAKYEWRPPHCTICKLFGHSCDKRASEKEAGVSYAEAAAKKADVGTCKEWPALGTTTLQQPGPAAAASPSLAVPQNPETGTGPTDAAVLQQKSAAQQQKQLRQSTAMHQQQQQLRQNAVVQQQHQPRQNATVQQQLRQNAAEQQQQQLRQSPSAQQQQRQSSATQHRQSSAMQQQQNMGSQGSQRPHGSQQGQEMQDMQQASGSQIQQQKDGIEIDEEGWQKARRKGRGRGRGSASQREPPRTRSRSRARVV